MASFRSNKETGIRNRNIILFNISYSGQIGNRRYWNYINSTEVSMSLLMPPSATSSKMMSE